MRNPKPTNAVSERIKFVTTKEVSTTGTASATPSLQLGGKVSAQEDRFWQPFECKYVENPHNAKEKHISALWEFCYMDKRDNFDLDDQLLPHVEFHVSKNPWPSISFTIACYYWQRPTTTSWLRRRGKVGWRDFCHQTRIVMPILEWHNNERLHCLHLPIPSPTTISPYFVEDYNPAEGDVQKLIFRTSAEYKPFVPHRSTHPCNNQGRHGGGPHVNSM